MADRPDLTRTLGLFGATTIVVGVVVGSGIFFTSGIMARALPSGPLLLAVWALAGLLTIAGALTIAEPGAAWPQAGGQYVYLREAYGSLSAFLFAWITMLVYQPGSIAALAVGFAASVGHFVPALASDRILVEHVMAGWSLKISAAQVCAASVILLLTWLNIRGVREGGAVQDVLTVIKVAVLLGFVVVGFGWGEGSASHLTERQAASISLAGFGVALVAALWTYDGWANLTFAAGEIRDPSRTIPIALLTGTLIITALYILTNAVYQYGLPLPALQASDRVAEQAATALFGPVATHVIAAAVVVSTIGAANGTIMTGARVFYAVSHDGWFFESIGRVHERHRTPYVALWVQGAWSCALALSGRYDQLFTYAMFCALGMYAAATCAVFTLRAWRPDVPRPYRVFGYPWMPLAYLAALLLLMTNTLIERPLESLAGLGMLAAGVPTYAIWARKRRVADRVIDARSPSMQSRAPR